MNDMKQIKKAILLAFGMLALTSCSGPSKSSWLFDSPSETCENDDALFDVMDKVYFCDGSNKTFEVSQSCLNDLFRLYSDLTPACRKEVQSDVFTSAEKIVVQFTDGLANAEFRALKLDSVQQNSLVFVQWKNLFKLAGNWYDTFGKKLYPDYLNRNGSNDTSFSGAYNRIFTAIQNALETNGDVKFDPKNIHAYFKAYRFALETSSAGFAEANIDGREFYMDIINLVLSEIDTRLQLQTYFLDFSCWLSACGSGSMDAQSETLVSLMASLDNESELTSKLQQNDNLDATLRRIFEIISDNQSRLIDILKTRTDSEDPLPGLGEDYERAIAVAPYEAPRYLQNFASIVQSYKRIESNKRKLGYYQFATINELRNGLDTQTRTAVLSRLDDKQANLVKQAADLEAKYNGKMDLLRQKIQQEVNDLQLDTSRQILNLQLDENTRSLMNIRESARQDSVNFADSLKNAKALLDSGYLNQPAIGGTGDFNVTQKDARYDYSNPLAEASFKTIKVAKGDIITLTFDKRYSPSCAVAKSEYKSVAVKGFTIPADGFLISKTQSTSVVSSVESYTTSSQYTDTNFSASVGPSTPLGSARVSHTTGFRHEEGVKESDSASQSSSEAFTTFNGLRLPKTPFPLMPAGAIVAVLKSKDSDGNNLIRKIFVGTGTTIVADADMDIKLYVNDCNEQTVVDTSALTGTYQIKRPIKKAGELLLDAIISGITQLDDKRDEILDLGQAGSVELEITKKSIVNDAYAAAAQQTEDFTKIRSLSELFTILIDQKAATIQKELIARDLDRQIQRDNVKIEEMIGTKNLQSAQRRVLDNLYSQSRLNQDVMFAGMQSKDVLNYFFGSVRPFIDIYYPVAKSKIQAAAKDSRSIREQVEALSNLDIPVNDKIKMLTEVIGKMQDILRDSSILVDSNTETAIVAVAMPRNISDKRIYSTITDYRNTDFFQAIANQASAVKWNLGYRDLYRVGGANFGLSTVQTRPIIRRAMMGIGLERNENITKEFLERLSGGWNITFTVGDFIKVPTSNATMEFGFDKNEYRNLLSKQIPIEFIQKGDLNELKKRLLVSNNLAGKGFSPFSSANLTETQNFFEFLNVDNEDLEMPLMPLIGEIYLMFEVEFQTDVKMDWLDAEISK
jgi:hypothetical protein